MDESSDGAGWYARRDGVVRGPFTDALVSRYILLGRIRLDDELSDDRVTWHVTRSVISLLPGEIQQLSSWTDYQQLVISRLQVDERKQSRRASSPDPQSVPASDRRSGNDRRVEDAAHEIARQMYGHDHADGRQGPRKQRLAVFAVTALLAVLVVAWLLPASG